MKALIIDDELHCREVLQSYIEDYCPSILEYQEASSVETGIEKVKSYQPDIVFLDIQLKDRTSFELLNALDEINFKIIFTTAYDNYAVKAFDYAAAHYLLKPITPKNFMDAVARCTDEVISNQRANLEKAQSFYLKTTNTGYNIVFEEVAYIQADGSYSTIYNADGGDVFASKKLGDFKALLPEYFFRIHNSIIVNMKFVRKIDEKEGQVILSTGAAVPISRRKKKGFKEALSFLTTN